MCLPKAAAPPQGQSPVQASSLRVWSGPVWDPQVTGEDILTGVLCVEESPAGTGTPALTDKVKVGEAPGPGSHWGLTPRSRGHEPAWPWERQTNAGHSFPGGCPLWVSRIPQPWPILEGQAAAEKGPSGSLPRKENPTSYGLSCERGMWPWSPSLQIWACHRCTRLQPSSSVTCFARGWLCSWEDGPPGLEGQIG